MDDDWWYPLAPLGWEDDAEPLAPLWPELEELAPAPASTLQCADAPLSPLQCHEEALPMDEEDTLNSSSDALAVSELDLPPPKRALTKRKRRPAPSYQNSLLAAFRKCVREQNGVCVHPTLPGALEFQYVGRVLAAMCRILSPRQATITRAHCLEGLKAWLVGLPTDCTLLGGPRTFTVSVRKRWCATLLAKNPKN